ncbi:hypothetical protein COCOBI_17-0770 [Coccomyxa sp. Obi]|nr:hypothetical protein COCOBI_17-0770 [Coccomyxa sp. Obi]
MKGSQESRDLVAYVGNIVLSLEARLLSVTYLLLGASAGFIHGSIKAGHKLQHNFTSADGLRELWLGSKHIGEEKDTRSFKDLLTSWVPWPQGSTKPANGLPALESNVSVNHVHTNGVATESEPEPVSTSAIPAKPLKTEDDFWSMGTFVTQLKETAAH